VAYRSYMKIISYSEDIELTNLIIKN
jgi:hypothetical protein